MKSLSKSYSEPVIDHNGKGFQIDGNGLIKVEYIPQNYMLVLGYQDGRVLSMQSPPETWFEIMAALGNHIPAEQKKKMIETIDLQVDPGFDLLKFVQRIEDVPEYPGAEGYPAADQYPGGEDYSTQFASYESPNTIDDMYDDHKDNDNAD